MWNGRVWLLLLLAVGASGAISEPGWAARHHRAAAHRHAQAPASHPEIPALNETVLQAEVLLARAEFSPGAIDGRDGDNFANALHAFQQANGLPVGRLDEQTLASLAQLSNEPVVAEYTIQPDDVAGPFAPVIPQDFEKMAQLPRLAYCSPRQLLAEKFHMSEGLLAALNPGRNFTEAGTAVTVANLPPISQNQDGRGNSGQGSGSSREPKAAAGPAAARVVVDKPSHAVLVYGADNRLLAFYPASIGSAEKPAPSGRFAVRSVAYDPTYTYNPAYGFKERKTERKVTVRPGPNNPVGLVWIGLSAKGYGIHGTPDPDKVGKTQSHGCVRLTNWDALSLAKLAKKGTPVDFLG
jgi:lipoprotein-anchoring transpeptidase ErfK/SrfK